MKTFKQHLNERCWSGYKPVPGKKPYTPGSCKKEEVEQIDEGRPSQRHPLEGHEYHKKTDAQLKYIAKDAHEAAEKMKGHNEKAENKYRDQVNDASSVLHFRKNGMPDWYKKKYGHMNEEVKQIEEAKTFNDIKKRYERNEDQNRHTENTLLLAKHFGTKEEKDLAQKHMDALNKHGHQPHYAENSKLHTKLYYRAKGMKEEVEQIEEGTPAWQRKEGKNPEGGLNQKGVESYRRENPGSKLQTAVTTKPSKLKPGSKAANRRKSFCARMSGMKKRLTSAKTANDPDSRINKSLRKWNC